PVEVREDGCQNRRCGGRSRRTVIPGGLGHLRPTSEIESGSCSGGGPPLNRPARARLYTWVALDAAFAPGWAGFARWIVPPMLVLEHPGRPIQALKQYLIPPPVLFLNQDLLGRWREFSQAVLIAVALHLTIVVMLSRSDRRTGGEGLARDDRAVGRTNLALS